MNKNAYNIKMWKKEADKALKDGDFWKATTCLLLAQRLEEKEENNENKKS